VVVQDGDPVGPLIVELDTFKKLVLKSFMVIVKNGVYGMSTNQDMVKSWYAKL
jgi:hypothetical protein